MEFCSRFRIIDIACSTIDSIFFVSLTIFLVHVAASFNYFASVQISKSKLSCLPSICAIFLEKLSGFTCYRQSFCVWNSWQLPKKNYSYFELCVLPQFEWLTPWSFAKWNQNFLAHRTSKLALNRVNSPSDSHIKIHPSSNSPLSHIPQWSVVITLNFFLFFSAGVEKWLPLRSLLAAIKRFVVQFQ